MISGPVDCMNERFKWWKYKKRNPTIPQNLYRVVILVTQAGQTMGVTSLPWTITEQNAAVIIWRILPFLSSLMPMRVEVTAF